MGNIDIVAVFGAGVVSMIIGMFWYSPMGFGNQWMKLSGINKKELKKAQKKGMAKEMVVAFGATLITAYVLDLLASMIGFTTFIQGAILGSFAWVGFTATVLLNSVLWEMKPVQLYIINAGHSFFSLVIAGGIVTAL